MKKTLSLLLCALLLCGGVLTGCDTGQKKSAKTELKLPDPVASTDNYRNFYQIFTQSYADSNNDGVGDFQGIIEHLDYLNDGDPAGGEDLGVDGIWLTPITPSESYHKYSVEDYYNVDSSFGTIDDFDRLVEECHNRGINIILDLVLNHISYKNPLFLNACEEVQRGKLDGDAQYFEFHEPDYYSADTKVVHVGDYVCEANFSETMPEWNLSSDKTREEFKKIAKFWLDRGVDGFRLDAVKYFENKHTDGVEFLTWFVNTCHELKDDVYLVGEDWSDDSEIKEYYASGIDSLFAFRFAQSTGEIVQSISTTEGQSLAKKISGYDSKMSEVKSDFINAVFLSNHDQTRIANALEGRGLEAEKFAANVYMLVPGNSFTYYGEEIGMKSDKNGSDRYHRMPMVFDSDNPQAISVEGEKTSIEPKYGGVKQQLTDENSLLNHYRALISAKLSYPAIARGRITSQCSFNDSAVGAYFIEHEGSKLLVIHNFSADDEKSLTVTDEMMKDPQVALFFGQTAKADVPAVKDGKLKLPALSSVVLCTKS